MSLEKSIRDIMEGRESIEATPRPKSKGRKELENVGRPDSAEPTSDKTTHTRQAEIYRKVIENKEPIMNRLSTSSTFNIFDKVREIVEAKKEKEKENSKSDKEDEEEDKDDKKSKKSDKDDKDEDDAPKLKGGKTEVDVEPETKKPVVDGEDMEDGKKKKMKKEDIDQIDELSKDTIQSYKDKQKEVKKDESPRKSFNRLVGAARADRKLAKEELSGNQHKIDVAPPKGKITSADFKKLRKEEVDFTEAELAHIDSVIEGYGDKAQKNQSRQDALKNLKGQESQKAKENAMKQQDIETQRKKEEILKQRQQRTALNQSYELEIHAAMLEAVKKSISDLAKNPAGAFSDAVKGVKSGDAGQTYITDTKKAK